MLFKAYFQKGSMLSSAFGIFGKRSILSSAFEGIFPKKGPFYTLLFMVYFEKRLILSSAFQGMSWKKLILSGAF